jgi:hypothetical protein
VTGGADDTGGAEDEVEDTKDVDPAKAGETCVVPGASSDAVTRIKPDRPVRAIVAYFDMTLSGFAAPRDELSLP